MDSGNDWEDFGKVDKSTTELIDFAALFERNRERYEKILGPLNANNEQRAQLLAWLWEMSCTVSRYYHGEDLTQKLLVQILEKTCQEQESHAKNPGVDLYTEERESDA